MFFSRCLRSVRSLGLARLLGLAALAFGLRGIWRTLTTDDAALSSSDATSSFQAKAGPFPQIKSTHSLVAKHVTPEKWAKLGGIKTKTSGFTLAQVRKKNV